ncbi:hypothetical protein ACIBCO_35955 [Streptomyces violascens]|uniref:hypothetical protein n=1 Tax=Streptomyces violascens TaxID=67381 RepID=UPI0037985FA7
MSSTGCILRTAQTVANHFGLTTALMAEDPHLATLDGRLHPAATIYCAVTGTTPDAFLTDQDMATAVIETNESVMEAIRWISVCLPTQPTGDDHLGHLFTWWDETNLRLGGHPNTPDFIGLLDRAAATADTLTDIPAQHPPLAA